MKLKCSYKNSTEWNDTYALDLYIKNSMKASFDTYLVKVHLVVHKILSCISHFLPFLDMEGGSHFGWSICENF